MVKALKDAPNFLGRRAHSREDNRPLSVTSCFALCEFWLDYPLPTPASSPSAYLLAISVSSERVEMLPLSLQPSGNGQLLHHCWGDGRGAGVGVSRPAGGSELPGLGLSGRAGWKGRSSNHAS